MIALLFSGLSLKHSMNHHPLLQGEKELPFPEFRFGLYFFFTMKMTMIFGPMTRCSSRLFSFTDFHMIIMDEMSCEQEEDDSSWCLVTMIISSPLMFFLIMEAGILLRGRLFGLIFQTLKGNDVRMKKPVVAQVTCVVFRRLFLMIRWWCFMTMRNRIQLQVTNELVVTQVRNLFPSLVAMNHGHHEEKKHHRLTDWCNLGWSSSWHDDGRSRNNLCTIQSLIHLLLFFVFIVMILIWISMRRVVDDDVLSRKKRKTRNKIKKE